MWNTNLIYSLNILLLGIKVEDFDNFNCSRVVRVLRLRSIICTIHYQFSSHHRRFHRCSDIKHSGFSFQSFDTRNKTNKATKVYVLFIFLPIHILFCYQYVIY